MLQIGDQFDHFHIRSHIAQGGMGDVYSAIDLIHSREAVLKIPDVMFIGDPAYYERFQRELDNLERVDFSRLDEMTGPATATPYSRLASVLLFAIAGFMMVMLVALGLFLQTLHSHGH